MKKELLILQGLPASGKTTYARELVEEGYKRVNRDEIREMLDNGKYKRSYEEMVRESRDAIIDLALINGFNVVVDDTNFENSAFEQLSLLADINDAEISVKVFKTPLEECIKRDKNRENSVGEDVITRMYNKYLKPRETQ